MIREATRGQEREAGWRGSFRAFVVQSTDELLTCLREFLPDASSEQVTAWRRAVPQLQTEASKVMESRPEAGGYAAILEYLLPMESRRPDVIFLFKGRVLVIECKGRPQVDWADIDQAHHYVTSLRHFHRECHDRPVDVVIALGAARFTSCRDHSGVHIAGMTDLHRMVTNLAAKPAPNPVTLDGFLAEDAYRPLPSLMVTVRQVIREGSLTRVHRSAAKTDHAVAAIEDIAQKTAFAGRRSLVLLSGAPGTGKTLVGIRVAVSETINSLAVKGPHDATSQAAIFLSGNGPLVNVLRYEFKRHGAEAKAFIRPVREYVEYYSRRHRTPPEHVLVFDEAQRAWDASKVQETHEDSTLKSEPEMFVQFSERVPEWCTVVGLIGGGQEIHNGEEGGIGQWATAISQSARGVEWDIYGPPAFATIFQQAGLGASYQSLDVLHLDRSIRFQVAADLHEWVAGLVDETKSDEELFNLARRCRENGLRLRATRDLDAAKRYLWTRYDDDREARFGMMMSSRDRCLAGYGVPQIPRFANIGEWYAEDDLNPSSCRRLREAITQFEAQGLELDAALVCWGNDFLWRDHPRTVDLDGAAVMTRWDDSLAKKWRKSAKVRNPLSLRRNTYRVLLTRGRQGGVIYVPADPAFDSTFSKLLAVGVEQLSSSSAF